VLLGVSSYILFYEGGGRFVHKCILYMVELNSKIICHFQGVSFGPPDGPAAAVLLRVREVPQVGQHRDVIPGV
jgi:hypothetical protein